MNRWRWLISTRCTACTWKPCGACSENTQRPDATSGADRAERALHILQTGVAHVLAMHHEDYVFADILGVIADALQRTHDPHHVEGSPDIAWVFHHEGDALAMDGFVFRVHHAITAR